MAARELGGVVDDDGQFRQGDGAPDDWDLDKVCSYQTFRVVRIRDGALGSLYWAVVTVIVLYVIIVAFHMDQTHQVSEMGSGFVFTKFTGKATAKGNPNKVFDEADLRFPVIEPAGAFVMTRRVVVKGQSLGNCVDWDNPEPCPCEEGVACKDGRCEAKGWCPSLGDGNAESLPAGAEVDEMEGLENTVLQINAGVAFPYSGNYFYVASGPGGRGNVFKNITLGELLGKADPPLKVPDLIQKGALIGVSFYWNCDITSWRNVMGDTSDIPTGLGEEQQLCPYHVVVQRLDGGQGFVQKRARTQRTQGAETRDAIYMAGLRIVVESAGVGRRVSIVLICIQAGSMFSLLKMASQIADFVMLRLYSRERQKAYERCKIIPTKDYSDLQDRIDQVQEQRQDFITGGGHTQSTFGAGSQVSLGLGGGARAGMGTAVLRGRGAAG